MPDLLLELFSEEIPARMQEPSAAVLQKFFEDAFKNGSLKYDQLKTLVTPRRLTLLVTGLPIVSPPLTVEQKGPKTSVPKEILEKFMAKWGFSHEELVVRKMGNDEVYFGVKNAEGLPVAENIKINVEMFLEAFKWPKSMRWGDNKITWVRPLHSILCLFNGKVVPVEFGGIKAGNVTHGHRFLSPKPITVKSTEKYESLLEKAHVIADRDKRKAEIWKQAEALAAKHGLTVKRDDGLLEEVTGLVEWPEVLLGNIDKQFMGLPPEVLSTSMRTHQKYFSLLHKTGKLAPHFLVVSNIKAKDGGKAIITGNERVLRARLSDAKFFWEQDLKKPLDEWAKGLSGVIFHEKLGTVANKVKRIDDLAQKLAEFTGADKAKVKRAAELCKADLVTGMVGEFAELQGIMGRYYAIAGKESPETADAIRDHYKPQGPNDSVPNSPVSICIALADKLDTLAGLFVANEKPTGSKDPFALRRTALGIIRIILENDVRLNIGEILQNYKSIIANDFTNIKGPQIISSLDPHDAGFHNNILDAYSFILERLKIQLRESIQPDIVSAAMHIGANPIAKGDDDLVRIVARAKALQDFLKTGEGVNNLVIYRRAANIVAAEEKKDKKNYRSQVNETLLETKEEKDLYKLFREIKPWIDGKIKQEQFIMAMGELSIMRGTIDAFFDKTTVNCDNPALRENRLHILAELKGIMDNIADFSKIEG